MGQNITRRQLLLGAISFLFLSCSNEEVKEEVVKIDLGPVSDFSAKYNMVSKYRIAIIRAANENNVSLKAISLVCSHQSCILKLANKHLENRIENNNYLICPCHGSEFNEEGEPTNGPAKLPLKWKKIEIEENNLVLFPQIDVGKEWELKIYPY